MGEKEGQLGEGELPDWVVQLLKAYQGGVSRGVLGAYPGAFRAEI
jgi:hypothetical protein